MVAWLLAVVATLGSNARDDAIRKLYDEAVQELDAGHFLAASDLFSKTREAIAHEPDAARQADAALEKLVARQLERTRCVLLLADHLPKLLTQRPIDRHAELHFLDGTTGWLLSADQQSIYVSASEERAEPRTPRSPRDLDAESLLKLAAHVHLDAANAVGCAFLALARHDDEIFDEAIERAATDPVLKPLIDSALAFDRGREQVPWKGYELVDGQWRSHLDVASEPLLRAGAKLLDKGRFAEAAEPFTQLHDTLLKEGLAQQDDEAVAIDALIARELERIRCVLALADHLPKLLADKASTVHNELRFLDGSSGRLVSTDATTLHVASAASKDEPRSPRELDAASLFALSGRTALAGEDALGRAFLAITVKDEKAFDAAIGKAAADPALAAAVGSAIAFARGLNEVPVAGFKRVNGRWLTTAEVTADSIAAELKKLFAQLRSTKAGEADAAKSRLAELKKSDAAALRAGALARRDELKLAWEKSPDQSKLTELRTVVANLKTARKTALELIFDENKYFYPCHPPECPPDKLAEYAVVQTEVARRVAAVRAIWGNEEGAPPPPQVTLTPASLEIVAELRTLRALLHDLGTGDDETDRALLPVWILPADPRGLNVRNFALDLFDFYRLERDVPVVATNASFVAEKNGVTAEELREVAITNAYRAMLGRRQLLFNAKLREAASAHSKWMETTGQLGHFEEEGSPSYSPEQRCELAGYAQESGENCANGCHDAASAHLGWITSSGHHRNLLVESHTEMGVAAVGYYWTQDFGGALEYKNNLIKPAK